MVIIMCLDVWKPLEAARKPNIYNDVVSLTTHAPKNSQWTRRSDQRASQRGTSLELALILISLILIDTYWYLLILPAALAHLEGGGRKFMGHFERHLMSQKPSESFKPGHIKWINPKFATKSDNIFDPKWRLKCPRNFLPWIGISPWILLLPALPNATPRKSRSLDRLADFDWLCSKLSLAEKEVPIGLHMRARSTTLSTSLPAI